MADGSDFPRTCAHCGKPLSVKNRSGYCRKHQDKSPARIKYMREYMRERRKCPGVKERDRRYQRERYAKIRADQGKPFAPYSVLSQLTEQERADYRLVKRKMGYSRDEALIAIKRADLVGGSR